MTISNEPDDRLEKVRAEKEALRDSLTGIPDILRGTDSNEPDANASLKEGDIIRYDPAYLRRNGWEYDAATGYWFDRWHAVACRGWHTAQLEQVRRDKLQAQRACEQAPPPPKLGGE